MHNASFKFKTMQSVESSNRAHPLLTDHLTYTHTRTYLRVAAVRPHMHTYTSTMQLSQNEILFFVMFHDPKTKGSSGLNLYVSVWLLRKAASRIILNFDIRN